MDLKTEGFGRLKSGEQAGLYIIENSRGMQLHISDYGASVVRLIVPDGHGVLRDVVLGYDDVSGYEQGNCYFGAVIGRYANRIGGASFELCGRRYELSANDGCNALHGGRDCYAHRLWEVSEMSDGGICFAIESPDMDQGFPGALSVKVRYSLTNEGELHIDYMAESKSDFAVPINLTNHSYFNLNGHDRGSVLDQKVQINADRFTELAADSVTTGELIDAAETPMDFRTAKNIGRDIDAGYYQLVSAGGYDHNYVIAGDAGIRREAAIMYSDKSGIRMRVLTDMPGMQFYSGNYIDGERGKDGASYGRRSGVCFETQFWPDAVNKPGFPQGMAEAGGLFESRTTYVFET